MFSEALLERASEVLSVCRERSFHIATAESCTGGLIVGCLTEVAGSSDVVDRGFVTYTNEAKTDLLGVPCVLFVDHGAVSEPVARAMVEGALARSAAQIAVAVTGIAGPGGGTDTKPVGLVHMAVGRIDGVIVHQSQIFQGDRTAVRLQTVETVLGMILDLVGED